MTTPLGRATDPLAAIERCERAVGEALEALFHEIGSPGLRMVVGVLMQVQRTLDYEKRKIVERMEN